jgi:hypothetical protein
MEDVRSIGDPRNAGAKGPKDAYVAWWQSAQTRTLDEVVEHELRYVAARRWATHRDRRQHELIEPGASNSSPSAAESHPVGENLVGLAFSGGGIRAATTCLGMVQALSRMRLLPQVDYLSTVSGGGYIGGCMSWLLSIRASAADSPDTPSPYTFGGNDHPLFDTIGASFPLSALYNPPGHRGKDQLEYLRTHGNFLITRKGLFTRETLRALGHLVGAALYNFSLVVGTLFLLTVLYVASAAILAPGLHSKLDVGTPLIHDASGKITQTPAPVLSCAADPNPTCRPPTLAEQVKHRGRFLLGAAGSLTTNPTTSIGVALGGLALGLLLFFVTVWLCVRGPDVAKTKAGDTPEDSFERHAVIWFAVISAGGMIVATWVGVARGTRDGHEGVGLFLPLLFLAAAWMTAFILYLVMPWADVVMGRVKGGSDNPTLWTRNFRSLWGATLAVLGYGVLLTLALVLLPALVYTLREYTVSAAIGALISMAAARALAWQAAPSITTRLSLPPGLRNFLLAVAVTLFCLLTVVAFASAIVELSLANLLVWGTAVAASLLALGFLIDLNAVSPHYFYRDRLAETYLHTDVAAMAGDRRIRVPFANGMEMLLSDLHGTHENGDPVWGNSAPYQLISAAINLAGSRDLTRKDRKSGYFLFSKMFCGSSHTGFRPTVTYRKGETKLARALTISGAAVSSAVGYATFFAQAFATVLLNLRLGLWVENPKDDKSVERREGGFVFWPLYLGLEMFANTSERRRLVNLSDGGHTGDNVGIYPLLQRRCKVIIACDAERDESVTFGSFTEALRHAYIDDGIDIDIDLSMLRPDPVTGLSRSHCAVGRVHYPDRDQRSWIIYMKNTLTGDEPAAVQNYGATHKEFPHESTADQFFDDAQFEAYRGLGVHIAEHTVEEWLSRVAFEGA